MVVPGCGLTKAGHFFAGWSCGNKIYQPGDFLKLEKDEILEAVWQKEEEPSVPAKPEETEKKEENLPAPVKPGETEQGNTQIKVPAPGRPKLTLKRIGNKVKLTWKKVKNADGYEISMKTGSGKYKVIARKGKTVKSYKRTVKSKKMVRFRVRTYRKAGKVKIYGKYSAVKKVKLKK